MIRFKVKMPMEQITEARRTCKVLLNSIEQLKQQRSALDEVDPIRDGIAARDRAEAEKQQIRDTIEETKASVAADIRQKAEDYKAEVKRQTALKGEDLNVPDYALIRDGLINDADQLQMMADRNPENYTLLLAIDRYAVARFWIGFTVISNAPSVEAFGENWFRLCEAAAHNPDGYAMMQLNTKGELRRLLNEYGVLDAAQLPDDEA